MEVSTGQPPLEVTTPKITSDELVSYIAVAAFSPQAPHQWPQRDGISKGHLLYDSAWHFDGNAVASR